MDRGTWTLKCQNCKKTFELEVKPDERVILRAQTYPLSALRRKAS